ncbi:hypothetical protein [Gorillibacterium massiliense]|uniref:hypothetical protein n=1 Tax=Gorillibacterium massiliense TaxID=1280390 RepID=UPI0004B424D2|nr:hypothetical protein [Gorillibacterium massiliense]
MIPVYPLTEEALLPHIGSPVLAVLQDGQEHVGFLHQVRNGRLTIGAVPAVPASRDGSTIRSKAARTKAAQARKAAINPPAADQWQEDSWPDPFFQPLTPSSPPSPPSPPVAPAPVTLNIKSLAGFYLLFL